MPKGLEADSERRGVGEEGSHSVEEAVFSIREYSAGE